MANGLARLGTMRAANVFSHPPQPAEHEIERHEKDFKGNDECRQDQQEKDIAPEERQACERIPSQGGQENLTEGNTQCHDERIEGFLPEVQGGDDIRVISPLRNGWKQRRGICECLRIRFQRRGDHPGKWEQETT